MKNNKTSHLKNTPSNDDSTPEVRPFMETLLQSSPGGEDQYDYNWPTRHKFLEKEILARMGASSEPTTRISSFYILQIAAERGFMLIADAIESMSDMFVIEEFDLMLNTTCSPVWQWDRYMSIATFVADDNGVESDAALEPGSSLGVLLEKLARLTTTQNAALVDVCERLWRDSRTTPLEESLEAMGFRLASAK